MSHVSGCFLNPTSPKVVACQKIDDGSDSDEIASLNSLSWSQYIVDLSVEKRAELVQEQEAHLIALVCGQSPEVNGGYCDC
jgi:hypothetical protein